MGFDYANVHLKYTIPLALVLTFIYRPLFTRIDIYKVCFLVIIAVVSTIPWDSYLIRRRIWSYPPEAVYGITVFDIPAEEVFFFIIQTYITSVFYFILSKSSFHPAYLLPGRLSQKWIQVRVVGQLMLGILILNGAVLWKSNGRGTYLGLILVWACPFVLLLWTLAYQFILVLPLSNTALPVLLPTLYLWIVDTIALRRGTWVIESRTKTGFQLWDGLDVEEALFFLATNCLIVFGLVAFDNAVAILDSACSNLQHGDALPSPILLIKALVLQNEAYDVQHITAIRQGVQRLRTKSRSFYLASSAFEGPLRVDLVLLYSFCRLADDLVDQAESAVEAAVWVTKLNTYLNLATDMDLATKNAAVLQDYIIKEFPEQAHLTLAHFPIKKLSKAPLYSLLKGFQQDLQFSSKDQCQNAETWPINDETALEVYGLRVAGTVAELCLDLVFHHYNKVSKDIQMRLREAARNMGIALQIVNIARDIEVDANLDRVYIPSIWIEEAGLTPLNVLKHPTGLIIERLRSRLLDKAFEIYGPARSAMEQLPREVRGPLRVAVDSYMEIGKTLRQSGYSVKAGRATVPKVRRLWVAWRALNT